MTSTAGEGRERRDGRAWDDRLRIRFPGMYRAVARWVWRASAPRSGRRRLRRELVERNVRRSYAAFNRNDLDALLPMYADDFVWDWSGFDGWPDEPVLHGAAGLRRGWGVFREAWHAFRVEPRDWKECGDRVLITCDMRGVGLGSGLPLERTWWQVATVRDGLVVSIANYSDRDEATRAAGLA